MIFSGLAGQGADFVGAAGYSTYMNNTRLARTMRLPAFANPIAQSRIGRRLDRNEQSSRGIGASIVGSRAVQEALSRSEGMGHQIGLAVQRGFIPPILQSQDRNKMIRPRGPFTRPASAETAMQMPNTEAAVFQTFGPGLTPPSPFQYGPKAGVAGAVPIGMRRMPSNITGTVSVRTVVSRRRIFRGE